MSKSLLSLQKQLQTQLNESPLQTINHPLLVAKGISVSVKRDDLLHPHLSGNKWRKLKYNLFEARANNIEHLVSFGGAYSNHIHALAAAGFYFNFKTTAIIRGEPHYANNPTLTQAREWGMKLHFVTRNEYRQRNEKDYLNALQQRFPDAFIIPEGGSNAFALKGVAEIYNENNIQCNKTINHFVTATGSGGTLAGLIAGLSNSPQEKTTKITGIAVLKEADYLNQQVNTLLQGHHIKTKVQWQLKTQFHGGGYAKISQPLKDFCKQFESQSGIPIEPIYTGKMFYALFELIKQDYFDKGDHIVALHTGGLQGLQGLKKQ